MKITADTNLLVRVAIRDDAKQMQAARKALAAAELTTIATPALCEFTWVMRHGYKQTPAKVAAGIRLLLASANVAIDRPAVEAGLAMLEVGGDFADGVIAFEGAALGGEAFVSFDKDAVKRLKKLGPDAMLLA